VSLAAIDRIMAFVSPEPNTGCWLWTGATHSDDYGTTSLKGRQMPAHRALYELLVGPVPRELDLDHLCRVHPCVNPSHLEPVTRRENLVRGKTFISAQVAQTHCLRGHEFTEPNTRMYRGQRRCRACDLARATRYYANNRAAISERRRAAYQRRCL
jgi:hypothetical protein